MSGNVQEASPFFKPLIQLSLLVVRLCKTRGDDIYQSGWIRTFDHEQSPLSSTTAIPVGSFPQPTLQTCIEAWVEDR